MIKITPQKNSIVERRTFWRNSKEVNCGVLWEWGYTLFQDSPEFLKDYDPKIGVILGDQYDFEGGEYSNGETLFFYTDNVTPEDLEEVKEIFNNMDGDEYNEQTYWTWDDSTLVMFGKLEIEDY